MKDSILNGKRILAVNDEPGALEILEAEILETAPNCHLEKATSYENASQLIASFTYDLVILDIMGVRGFDLLKQAVAHNFPVVMLTVHALNPEALKRSIELGGRVYLPKEKPGGIVPFLEDILRYKCGLGWRHLLKQMEGFFNRMWLPFTDGPSHREFEVNHSIVMIESNRQKKYG